MQIVPISMVGMNVIVERASKATALAAQVLLSNKYILMKDVGDIKLRKYVFALSIWTSMPAFSEENIKVHVKQKFTIPRKN